jgi:hypothetical protein
MLSMRATLSLLDGPAILGMSLQKNGYGLRVGINEVNIGSAHDDVTGGMSALKAKR